MAKFLNISVDNSLGGEQPSNEIVSSQKAIKEYITNVEDLENYTTTEDMNELLEEKQDNLQAGENISIEDNVISASTTTVKFRDW